jgi:hypothetical protein
MYPAMTRIVVGSPQQSPLIEGYTPDLGGFSCSTEAAEALIAVLRRAVDEIKAAQAAGR